MEVYVVFIEKKKKDDNSLFNITHICCAFETEKDAKKYCLELNNSSDAKWMQGAFKYKKATLYIEKKEK